MPHAQPGAPHFREFIPANDSSLTPPAIPGVRCRCVLSDEASKCFTFPGTKPPTPLDPALLSHTMEQFISCHDAVSPDGALFRPHHAKRCGRVDLEHLQGRAVAACMSVAMVRWRSRGSCARMDVVGWELDVFLILNTSTIPTDGFRFASFSVSMFRWFAWIAC